MRWMGYCYLAFIACTGSLAQADNWPQWRGTRVDGISAEKNLPSEWNVESGKNIAWKLALPGQAGATPVVWGNRIFLTSAEDKDLLLLCIDTSGKELWRKTVGSGDKSARGDEGNSASPSPVTDGKHVWSMMGTGDMACYDFDGNEVWKKDLQKEYGKFNIQFGMTSTPVLDGERLYLQLIHSGAAKVIALDKSTGKEIWSIKRESDARDECEHSYASPIIYRDAQRSLLISHGADYVIAYNPENGQEVWRCGGLNPKDKYNPTLRLVASPVAIPGLIVVPTAKGGPVLGLKPDGQGDITGKEEQLLWRLGRNTPDVPSPLIHDGLVYLCRESGNLIVLDAKTGEQYYENRTHADRHRSSPVYADGKIYLSSRDGTVSVVKAGPQFELLAKNKLQESLSASPAIADGTIYLRGFNTLYAIKQQPNE
jgi:outer membrane protein assembly factor BamB